MLKLINKLNLICYNSYCVKKIISSLALFIFYFFLIFNYTFAAGHHQTLIINQIRGDSCCDSGSFSNFQQQLSVAQNLDLPINFALRFDSLTNPQYQALFQQTNSLVNYGAFLEIIPELATAAGVSYLGNSNNWYQAGNAYLIGYSSQDRLKIIDTYMTQFHQIFDYYPNFSVAWMIDPLSLQYLKSKYGVLIHQITREQLGTDSYTLDGGPVHYPYFPSQNWALIPNQDNATLMPLIVRQTITDPVYNYGDQSNSYTSQPNDYTLRQADFDYFKFLFSQAHQQLESDNTFALIGLENSMSVTHQTEFFKQLEFVYHWQNNSNKVVTIASFYQEFISPKISHQPIIYHGQAEKNSQEKAWWINTDQYRIRLRLSAGELFISDFRVYNSSFTDPYLLDQADHLGQWFIPFLLKNSISYTGLIDDPIITNDDLNLFPNLKRLTLSQKITNLEIKRDEFNNLVFTDNQNKIITFQPETISFFSGDPSQLAYQDPVTKEVLWQLAPAENLNEWKIKINQTDLNLVRRHEQTFSRKNSSTFVSNQYAIAARNPIRLIFYPRNISNENLILTDQIKVSSDYHIDKITISPPNSRNGMIFIDLSNTQPLKTQVTITYQDYTANQTVFFCSSL